MTANELNIFAFIAMLASKEILLCSVHKVLTVSHLINQGPYIDCYHCEEDISAASCLTRKDDMRETEVALMAQCILNIV